ncbi:MAG: tripartite tricarboxylate transporter substrate binding protein [Burkholderiales bacterium]
MKLGPLSGAVLFCAIALPMVTTAQPGAAPIHLVVPLSPGGPSDQAARLLAKELAKALGQDVIVENKPGASGAIAAQTVALAAPDGRTLLFAPSSMSGLPVLVKSPPYASLTEFAPLGAVGGNQVCLFIHPSLPAATATEFVNYAKANPDKLSYGASAPGEYLAMANLIKSTGIRMGQIPYKGSVQMMPDLLEGRVQAAFMPAGSGATYAQAGKLKLLACNVTERLSGLPDTPTLAQANVPITAFYAYHLLLAPAKLPEDVKSRLAAALQRAANEPSLRAEYARLYIPAQYLTPAQTTENIRDGEGIWAQFVRETGFKPE